MKALILRTVLIYLCVLFAMRMMGKRQLGELQPGELVSTILISNLASISIESLEVPLSSSLVPLFLITAIELLSSALSFKSRRFADFVSGRPKTVIRDGVVDQGVLRQLRLSLADLLEALRAKDVFDPREVSCAIVETNGSVSICLKGEQQPATRGDLALQPPTGKAYVPFVLEGEILYENLRWCGKDKVWLDRALAAQHAVPGNVLALIGSDNEEVWLVLTQPSEKAAKSDGNGGATGAGPQKHASVADAAAKRKHGGKGGPA